MSDGPRPRLRPLRRLGPAPLPDAVGPDGRRRATSPSRAARTGPGATLDRFLQRRRRAGRRRRLAADPGPQPDLPVRRRGAVLGRRPRRRAVASAGPAAPAPPPRIVRHFVATRRPGRARPAHPRLARAVAAAGAVVLRAGLAVLGEQGPARHRAARRPSGVDGRRGAAAGRGAATRCGRCARPAGWSPAPGPTASSAWSTTAPTTPSRAPPSPTRRCTPGWATPPRPARCSTSSGWADAARPVGHPRRRRGPGHPPQRACALLTVRRRRPDGVGVAGSTRPRPLGRPGSGSARPRRRPRRAGRRPAGHLTVYSLVRGPWELRLSRVDDLADGVEAAALRLRIGGWAGRRGRRRPTAAPAACGRDRRRPDQRLDSVHGGGTAGVTAVPRRRARWPAALVGALAGPPGPAGRLGRRPHRAVQRRRSATAGQACRAVARRGRPTASDAGGRLARRRQHVDPSGHGASPGPPRRPVAVRARPGP